MLAAVLAVQALTAWAHRLLLVHAPEGLMAYWRRTVIVTSGLVVWMRPPA